MSNRWLRFGIAILAIGAASVAGYRVHQQQQQLVAAAQHTRTIEHAAETALTTVAELKAALHAYVAEGQGDAFWTARAAMLIDRLRASVLELDQAATAAGLPVAESLNLIDRIAAAEQRAREHVRRGQKLLAGEVIFTEARDVLDALRMQLGRARSGIVDATGTATTATTRQQAILALSAVGILSFGVLLLAIPTAPAGAVAPATIKSAAAEPADAFESSARLISRTPLKATPATSAPAAGGAAKASANTAPSKPAATGATAANPTSTATSSMRTDDAAATSAPPSPTSPMPSLREAAAICVELGRASQSIEVSNLLARAAKVLDAAGAVLWLASIDGRELYPAASAGYDERLLARIGSIPRTSNNVTASAIRTGTPRTSPRNAQSAAAVAIPLLTPLGAVGVLSAEFKNVPEVDETRMAVATIFAAQLASLVGSKATASAATTANAK